MSTVLLDVRDLHVRYRLPPGNLLGAVRLIDAVRGVSFEMTAGETIGIVGESGCGKSTLARVILGLLPASRGEVVFASGLPRAGQVQMVFQNPTGSLNPRMTVAELVAEPLRILRQRGDDDIASLVSTMAARCGLDRGLLGRYAHELSGGQCQRVAIARALVSKPDLLVCDEAVSSLDVSIQAQIINLLGELRDEMQLSMLFISHDLAVVRHLCDRVLVMYRGHIVEDAATGPLISTPQHPYTKELLSTATRPRCAN